MDWSKMIEKEPLWNTISEQQFLSEDFMREHKHLLNWKYICYRQQFSISFLQEMEEDEKIYQTNQCACPKEK